MMKSLLVAVVLVAAASAATYPRYEQLAVARSPKDFDLLYSSTSGPHNETWYFNYAVNLTSIIIPSQIFNFWSSGAWTSGTYKEDVALFVYETKLSRTASMVETNLVATGSFNGTVSFGQELHIPLKNTTLGGAPLVQRYFSTYSGYHYTLNIVFKKTGIYPWYTSRVFSTHSYVDARTNTPGIAIGVTYTFG